MKIAAYLLPLIATLSANANANYGASVDSWRLSIENNLQSTKQTRANTPTDALTYLNTLRNGAGMISFTPNSILDTAALNHSNYLVTHNISGHYETAGTTGFTGVQPWDRSAYAGYLSTVTENVSTGQESTNESVDGLFSAIYHRFGFLDFASDEIGIGINSSGLGAFTYKMGNKKLNDLCAGTSFSGFGTSYTGVCSDEKFKIEKSSYENSQTANKAANPSEIIWPYANQTDVPPVFFEESPDPLPDYSVSGYPVSISFNDYYHTNVSLSSFTLYDSSNSEITNTRLLSSTNDPNAKMTTHEFALFPLTRLDWGKKYKASVSYTLDGVQKSKEWYFTTRAIGYDYYKITQTSTNVTIQPNKTYALYVVPSSKTDVLTSYRSRGTFVPTASFIDSNTISISTNEAVGGSTTLTLSNGKVINVTIAASDSALSSTVETTTTPTSSSNTATQDGVCIAVITSAVSSDGLTCKEYPTPCDVPTDWTKVSTCENGSITYASGWNLLSLPTDTKLTDTSKFGSFDAIFKFVNNQWELNPFSITSGEGFWLSTQSSGTFKQYGLTYEPTLSNLTSGWHLLGTGKAISGTLLKDFIVSYVFRNNNWVLNPTTIDRGEGFWVLK